MKKFLTFLYVLLPSTLFARGGIDLIPNPKAILSSTNTWSASQTFTDSTTFVNPVIGINGIKYTYPASQSNGCLTDDGAGNLTWGTCGSGGGGGGGSGAYFDGTQTVSITTFTIPYVTGIFNTSFATIPVFAATAQVTGSWVFVDSQTFKQFVNFTSSVAIFDNGNLSSATLEIRGNNQTPGAINSHLYLGQNSNNSQGLHLATINSAAPRIWSEDILNIDAKGAAGKDIQLNGMVKGSKVGINMLGVGAPTQELDVNGNEVIRASATAWGGYTSTTGFLGASATFFNLNSSNISGSSFSLQGATLCFNQTCFWFAGISSSPLFGVDYVFHLKNGMAYFGGDAVGSGSAGGTSPSLQSPATGPYNLNGVGAVILSTGMTITTGSIILGDTTNQFNTVLAISSYAAGPYFGLISFTTGAATPQFYWDSSSFTLLNSTFIVTGPLLQGTTIGSQPATTLAPWNNYIVRLGSMQKPPTGAANNNFKYVFTDPETVTRMILMNNSGEGVWGVSSTPSTFFGSNTSMATEIRTNNTIACTWDTSQNMNPAGNISMSATHQIFGVGSAAAPALSNVSQQATGITINSAGARMIDFIAAGVEWGSMRTNGWTFGGGADVPRATVGIGTLSTIANTPMLVVSSNPANNKEFSIMGSSITSGVAFGVFPTSTTGFGINPSTYAMAVSSCVPFRGQIPTAPYTFSVDTRAHINETGTNPALTTCGTSTLAPWSNDMHGYVTVTGVVTSCLVTFAIPHDTQADCIVGDDSTAIAAVVTSPTNVGFTASFGASLGGGHFTYVCRSSD